MKPEDSGFDIEELLRAEAFPHATTGIALRETHISWVVLTGPYAYKIKKPVRADFIDATTLEQRHHYCKEELRLNGRLAPELYLDVITITRVDGRLAVGGSGPAVEYAVRMRQFAADDELPALLVSNAVRTDDLVALAAFLARFHLDLPATSWTGTFDRTAAMFETVLGNLAQLAAELEGPTRVPALGKLIDWTGRAARTLEEEFQQRERSGYIRECHGDLHTANIVRSDGRLVPFDCIEFDPDLRFIDVINDIAFLVMDLASHGRADLAFALLSRYLEITGDYEGVRLLPFYAVYRALVRAKVDAYAAEQLPARAADFRERLERRLHAALYWTEPRDPVLVIMHGASGSGKSWLSERLVPTLHAIRIRSDLERKRLAGIPGRSAPANVGQGIYTSAFSHRVYGRLADCAEICLRAGCNVIVDAAFLDAADRELFQGIAARLRVGYLIVACQADAAVLTKRIEERTRLGHDPSDATTSVLAEQLSSIRPFTSREQPHVISVDTRDGDAVQSVKARLRRSL